MGKSIGCSSIEVLQTNNYYPFGLTLTQNNYNPVNFSRNKYLYNGKEIQDDELNGKFFGINYAGQTNVNWRDINLTGPRY